MSATAAPDVGDVVPVYVSVASGNDVPHAVVPTQVFAVNDSGQHIAPLEPAEAARQAGSAKELSSAVQSAAISGAGGAGLGAATGAVAGVAGNAGDLSFGSVGAGALIGAAFGALTALSVALKKANH